ncbi:MAG TPA: hypothetical protein VLA88_03325 [Candidatus Saccharimonadales bacterium]|nr:hypothetical protein [Candidatus Saccharimonadales bacterium]
MRKGKAHHMTRNAGTVCKAVIVGVCVFIGVVGWKVANQMGQIILQERDMQSRGRHRLKR